MLKRILLLLALLTACPVAAQTVGIVSGATPIIGGSTGDCVTKASNGTVAMAGCGSSSPTTSQTITATTATSPAWQVQITGDTNPRMAAGLNSVDGARIAFGPGNASLDTFLRRSAAATLALGAPDAAAPVAQTIGVQNVVTGTTNTAGTTLTIQGSQGTGTGNGGNIIFQVAPPSTTGSTPNTLVSTLLISGSVGNVTVGTSGSTNSSFRVQKAITGSSTTAYGILNDGTVASTITSTVAGMRVLVNTTAASFTLTNWSAVKAEVGTIGAASAITNMRGYECDSSFVGGVTQTACLYSNIAISGTLRYAVYAAGTAPSHFGGAVDITGTIATSAPSGASAGLWKLGSLVTGAVVADTTRSVFVDIGGTVYKLLVAQ